MKTVYDIANYILVKLGPMSTMKLQKLCYYAQAWSLAWDGVPLFNEDFQAWANGPVCPELYDIHRGEFYIGPETTIKYAKNLVFSDFSDNEKETLDVVISDYGDKEAHWLSELTHKERPWLETRGTLGLGERSKEVIPKELMQEYYAGLING